MKIKSIEEQKKRYPCFDGCIHLKQASLSITTHTRPTIKCSRAESAPDVCTYFTDTPPEPKKKMDFGDRMFTACIIVFLITTVFIIVKSVMSVTRWCF